MKTTAGKPVIMMIAGVIAIGFGVLTLYSGGSVLFVDGPAREAAGNYVPFVLWFNFLAGFVYVFAGIGLLAGRGWAVRLAMLIALATLLVFVALGFHVWSGGAYEPRTIKAMILRSTVWLAIAFATRYAWKKSGKTRR